MKNHVTTPQEEKNISPSLSSNNSEQDLEDDDYEYLQDMNRKIINFKDHKNYYHHMCRIQNTEVKNKFGKSYYDSFTKSNFIQINFTERIKKPENYKKMCELQLEEVKRSQEYQSRIGLDRVRRVEGPKQYLCSKCGQPKKGHVCTATDEDETKSKKRKEDDGPVSERRTRSRLTTSHLASDPKIEPVQLFDANAIYLNHVQEIQTSEWKNRHKKIIIIGAGIAGIKAAQELKKMGYEATIIEGRDRTGGRIHTLISEELKQGSGIDIGASFIYGNQAGNPLINLCKDLGKTIHPCGNNFVLYDTDGNQVNPALDKQIEDVFNQLIAETGKIRGKPSHLVKRRIITRDSVPENAEEGSPYSQSKLEEDISLGKCLSEIISKHNNISDESWKVLEWYLTSIEGIYGADLSWLSLKNWDQDDTYNYGSENSLILQGYGNLIDSLAQGLDIRLGFRVDRIDYGSPYEKIKVETSKGTFEADYVICTVPLGILKTGGIIFTPPLPNEKISAINRLGFGLLNKLVLFFPQVFWDSTADYIGSTSISSNRGEFYLFLNMFKVTGSPVLVALIAGQAALRIENCPGEEVVSRAISILQKIYKNVPSPARAVVTRWANDPFSMGAFSYMSVGCTGDEYDILAKPLMDRLFFAGEHTHRQHPSTVTGAYMSGVRVALEVARKCNLAREDDASNYMSSPVLATSETPLQIPQRTVYSSATPEPNYYHANYTPASSPLLSPSPSLLVNPIFTQTVNATHSSQSPNDMNMYTTQAMNVSPTMINSSPQTMMSHSPQSIGMMNSSQINFHHNLMGSQPTLIHDGTNQSLMNSPNSHTLPQTMMMSDPALHSSIFHSQDPMMNHPQTTPINSNSVVSMSTMLEGLSDPIIDNEFHK